MLIEKYVTSELGPISFTSNIVIVRVTIREMPIRISFVRAQ
mgnify:CR=1 FL=1